MKNKELKGFLAGLGIGSVLAGVGVYLIDPDNRAEIKKKANEFKGNVEEMLSKLQNAIEEAKMSGKQTMVEELEQAQKTLEKAQKKIK
ncbi:hypothetical protein GF362_04010 [Candidatus Dojkabacteria bacterium]|nr:hypothetical protein [Candidatus Dojkabacteria bacterium]